MELFIERRIAAPPEKVWQVWTERLPEWWAPRPWTTELLDFDLRPGGRSRMIMRGPETETEPMEAVFLEVTPARRIAFTDALTTGWFPQKAFMVAVFDFTPDGSGTLYRAAARHWDEAALEQHKAMGFEAGWGAVAGQLAELAEA